MRPPASACRCAVMAREKLPIAVPPPVTLIVIMPKTLSQTLTLKMCLRDMFAAACPLDLAPFILAAAGAVPRRRRWRRD